MANYQQFELLKKSAVVDIAADLNQQADNRLSELNQQADQRLIDFDARTQEWQNARGYDRVGTFNDGFTISERNQIAYFYDAGEPLKSTFFRWDGPLPKNVPAGATPEMTGGIQPGAWADVGHDKLREELLVENFGGARIKNNVVAVNGLKGLAAIPPGLRRSDLLYENNGPYVDSTLGGGTWKWKADEPKSNHNGGTVVDPDRVDAWDGTQSDLATLFAAGSGGENGCFVRTNKDGLKKIDLSVFGVSETNTAASNSLSISQAINKSSFKVFILSQRISMSGKGVTVDRPSDYIAIKSEGDGFIDITDGPGEPAFLLNRCRSFIIDGIRFNEGKDPLVGSPGCAVGVLDTEKITTVRVTNNLLNHCRAFVGASFSGYTPETIVGLGVKNLIVEGNEITNAYKGMIGRLIRIVDMPYDLFSFSKNKIGHFHGELVSAVNDNIGYSNLQRLFRCEDNHIEWDDDFIIPDDGSFESFTYLTPYLVRCDKIIHRNNYQYGVKTHQLVACYESYYGARILEAEGNKYINCFTTQPRPLTGQLMKCKGGPIGVERNISYKRNTYLIERDYLSRLGIDEGSVSHALFQLTDGTNPAVTSIDSNLIVEDNDITLINVDSSYVERFPKSLRFRKNGIKFSGTTGGSLQALAFNDAAERVEISDNTVECVSAPLDYRLFGILSGSVSKNVIIQDNYILGSSRHTPYPSVRASERLYLSHVGDGDRLPYAAELGGVIDCRHTVMANLTAYDDSVSGRIYIPAQRDSGIYQVSYTGRTVDTSAVDTMRIYVGSDQNLNVGDLIRIKQEWKLTSYSTTPGGYSGEVSYEFIIHCVDDGGTPRNKIIILDDTDVVQEYFLDTTDGDGTALKITTTGSPAWNALTYNAVDKSLDFSPTFSSPGGIFSIKSECVKTNI